MDISVLFICISELCVMEKQRVLTPLKNRFSKVLYFVEAKFQSILANSFDTKHTRSARSLLSKPESNTSLSISGIYFLITISISILSLLNKTIATTTEVKALYFLTVI